MVLPIFLRTLDEIQEPLARGSIAEIFHIEHCAQVVISNDPIWAKYEATGDVDGFATAYTYWVRAVTEPSLFGVLSADRTPEQKQEIIEGFYAELRRVIAADPEGMRCYWRLAELLIRKKM
jgi:hypothetical protein